MHAALRAVAFTIIVALLFVPALTRVHQRLQHSNAGTLISSYSKSAEAPPDKLIGDPPVLLVSVVLDALASEPVAAVWHSSPDEPLASDALAPPDALRAPPLA